jgi:hypothetical protein
MACGGTISRRLCLLGACVAALALSACGSSSKSEPPGKQPAQGPGAPKGAPTPREAIIQFFEAKRVGNAELGCSLESKDFQIAQYKQAGQACLDNLANKQPQTVWAKKIKIDKLDEAPNSAAATIRPNAGSDTPAEITLVHGEGGWLVNSLR